MGVKIAEPKLGHINISCDQCGKPITKSNKYGMFCEDLCDLEESKKAFGQLKKLAKSIFPDEDFNFLDK